jgi:uncharacterized protein (TIGR01777 family)
MSNPDVSLRVVLSGGSGLIGTALTSSLRARQCRVTRLVRREPAAGSDDLFWHPDAGELNADALEDVDAVIHLGGVNIASGRWTRKLKTAIRDSRVKSTLLLSTILARLKRPPRTFVCASATGYYGDRGSEILTEDSRAGTGFLATLCHDWEAATNPAAAAGIRVVNLRTGVVLSPHGGALARMLPTFKAGLGGVLGRGDQYVSWIALHDAVRAIEFVLVNDTIVGPVNIVAPNAVTNRDLTRTLGRVLKRPTLFRVPAFVVRIAFGEMGQALLLEGHRLRPFRLEQAGFEFDFPTLEGALRHELDARK